MNVMRDAFQQCYPLQRDLPPAISAALARLAELEAAAASEPAPAPEMRSADPRERQFA
jgi:hypothetical protein